MSRTTPESYYEAFVEPNFQDYLERPWEVRRGFNACVPASQLADIMIAYCWDDDPPRMARWKKKTPKESIKALRIDLCERESAFNTIQSAATAYKHLHAKALHYQIDTAGRLSSVTVPKFGDVLVANDVVVHRLDGKEVSLTAALEAVVMHMWPAVLGRRL